MFDPLGQPYGGNLGPPPAHPQPRRASPKSSITLRHHRLSREASLRPHVSQPPPSMDGAAAPRQTTSGESNDPSENSENSPTKWFDNENRNARHGPQTMDVTPPFFQKASDSSSADLPSKTQFLGPPPAVTGDESSSTDDYRCIVDDLTIQIQRLREENKRLRSRGPEVMKDQQLFEVRCHDLLSRKKKRALETTLREFAASLKDKESTRTSGGSSQRKRSSSSRNPKGMYSSGSGTMSKHASSTASRSRPVDSAYASGSGPYSSGTSLTRPSFGSVRSSGCKVENYLRDIPEGLYQGPIILTDKEKKKMVVRRLEEIFTGRITGRSLGNGGSSTGTIATDPPLASGATQVPIQAQGKSAPSSIQPLLPPPPAPPPRSTLNAEPNREAQMFPRSDKKGGSRDNHSTPNSDSPGDDNGKSNGQVRPPGPNAGASDSSIAPPLEQRPTRPLDLDPDRVQVPSENMGYLRHLGLVPPELLHGSKSSPDDVPTDADGWVYLNLLCNMAQLHMFSVTPGFIRAAVSEKSTKFQLSPDGHKIRWRGGCEGTKFSSDSSGDASKKSPMTDEAEGSEEGGRHSKRQKVSSRNDRASAQQAPQCSPSTFHYKPMFARHESPEETSTDSSGSYDPDESCNQGSRSGSGSNQRRRKRRANGAVIYYSGAPFCTDLSRDPGESSSDTYMLSEEKNGSESPPVAKHSRPALVRTASGSSLQFRPLSDGLEAFRANARAGSVCSDDAKNIEMDMPWSDSQHACSGRQPMQASGTFGIEPRDHFMITVTTRRPRMGVSSGIGERWESCDPSEFIAGPLAPMSTASPIARQLGLRCRGHMEPSLAIDYISRDLKTLAPSPVPEPLSLVPCTDTASSCDSAIASLDISANEEVDAAEELEANSADAVDLSSGAVADGEFDDDEMMTGGIGDRLSDDANRLARKSSESSVSTAGGGVASGYTSDAEDSLL